MIRRQDSRAGYNRHGEGRRGSRCLTAPPDRPAGRRRPVPGVERELPGRVPSCCRRPNGDTSWRSTGSPASPTTSATRPAATASPCSTGSTTSSTGAAAGTATDPVLRQLTPTIQELDLPLGPVPRPDRGEPPGPGRPSLRDVRRARRLLHALGRAGRPARAPRLSTSRRPSGSRSPTTSASGSSSSSTSRTSREDAAADRIYLPLEDLDRAGCLEADLRAAHANPAVRDVVAIEVERARALLGRRRAARPHAPAPSPASRSPASRPAGLPRSTRSSGPTVRRARGPLPAPTARASARPARPARGSAAADARRAG